MKYVYFDASSGVSGDMILGALMDLGITLAAFSKKMGELQLPVEITATEVKRASLRGLKVDVRVRSKKKVSRKWRDVQKIIENSTFPSACIERANLIFHRLFQAEAYVHGRELEDTHLHEAGADDAIIDIIGSSWMLEELRVRKFYASPLNLGRGWVKSSHGMLPVPPPAVGELLKDIPVYSAHVEKELVTPTGAAILSTIVDEFLPLPELCYHKIGYGAGSQDFPGYPNILRVFYGDADEIRSDQKVHVIETNIDDENPQILGHFMDVALKRGALDVFFTPVFTKKNRPATKLTILAELDKIDDLVQALFRETSTIGVRHFPVQRRVLKRDMQNVRVLGIEIPVKVATIGEDEINVQPEFSACLEAAERANRPLREVMQLARNEFVAMNRQKRSSQQSHVRKGQRKKS